MYCIRFMKKVFLLFSDRNIPLQSTPYAIYVSSKWDGCIFSAALVLCALFFEKLDFLAGLAFCMREGRSQFSVWKICGQRADSKENSQ